MDFYKIKERSGKKGVVEIYPDFVVCRSKFLMVQGKAFYAIWDEAKGLWSTDEYDVQRLVDQDLLAYKEQRKNNTDDVIHLRLMSDFSSKIWLNFRNYLNHLSDSYHPLDQKLTFANTKVKKTDYVSKRLPYPLEFSSEPDSWNEIVGTLYDPPERAKLEWAIGAIVSGDSKDIQKFMVLYGAAGAGKSTILRIIKQLFKGYTTTFEAKELTRGSNSFSTEMFRSSPLVAIQQDSDLSRIEDNTKLNSIISHEDMTINEKFKPQYTAASGAFLFLGTNKPVKITDAKSGIIRRLIDVHPNGGHIPSKRYQALMSQITFELGSIAQKCLDIYRSMGKDYYDSYRPIDMIMKTDVFFDFVKSNFDIFFEQGGTTLHQAYDLYKSYCEETLVEYRMPRYKFKEELKNYFEKFEDRGKLDGNQARSVYSELIVSKLSVQPIIREDTISLTMDKTESLFDELCASCPAQYATENEIPSKKWRNVTTELKDIDTRKLHYVRVPDNHIVIDFDLKGDDGEKSAELNLEEASKWPPTYSEFSKSGKGVHLHYIYDGDVSKLSRVYSDGIEVKVFTGESSLRRKLSKCNDIPVATINSGLPLKETKVINSESVKSEIALRELINRNLRKEIHPGTKPSIDFIYKILEDAYSSNLSYDITDMRPKIISFANNSTNHALYCLGLVNKMKFQSDTLIESVDTPDAYNDDRLAFFDVEVFPNLFVIVWKYSGADSSFVRMINPSPLDVEKLMKLKLVGFNCRRYDNHILYARYMGYSNEQLYGLSQKIINEHTGFFGAAYGLSYTDVYDFASKKQSLKLWEIELGIHHQELGLPWDEPVDPDMWEKVGEYCENDVMATEATFNNRKDDFVAREILADLSGLTVNDTTNSHTTKIMFGNEKKPQKYFVYTDLSEEFPGYEYKAGKSSYKGEDPGEGGYVYSEPGIYKDVALLDIASMHPSTIVALNLFGKYTERFKELLDARIAIKHNSPEAKTLLNGALAKYLDSSEDKTALAYALKIALNSVYGLTSAKFDNAFRDIRNKDNIVAKRGALFMIDLKHAVQEKGFSVAHIKTDSIKIPDATPEIIQFVCDFGKQYGYNFEHEATYSKICLVNKAVYIARFADPKWCEEHYGYVPKENSESPMQWTATGAQFQHPYVFKTLFSHDGIEFPDLCETKSVKTALYLDMNEGMHEGMHDYHFVGKSGLFVPMMDGAGGGVLCRKSKEGKMDSATGAKGTRWLEAEAVQLLSKQAYINYAYFDNLVNEAAETIRYYGDFESFVD